MPFTWEARSRSNEDYAIPIITNWPKFVGTIILTACIAATAASIPDAVSYEQELNQSKNPTPAMQRDHPYHSVPFWGMYGILLGTALLFAGKKGSIEVSREVQPKTE